MPAIPKSDDSAASPWQGVRDRERDRLSKQEAVLTTAARAFNARGFHATSLDDVAAELKVTKPTIYHYFANKDEILFECVRRGLDAMRDAAASAAEEGGSGAARLRRLLTGYAIVIMNDFGFCVARTTDEELSPDSRRKFRALKREIDLIIRGVVTEGMADGSLRPGDVRLVTFTMTGAINAIGRWRDPSGPLDARAIAEGTVDILMTGIATPGKTD